VPDVPAGDYDLKPVADEPTLRQYQALVDRWIATYGVRYFSELNILAQLVEEVGEVARIVGRRYGEQSGDDPGASLGDELADVLFTVICLANKTGVDLGEELARNLEKKTRRDATRHKENEKLAGS
jgi:NTP pyrophosphatase (non-canonical NTP hydrolase)